MINTDDVRITDGIRREVNITLKTQDILGNKTFKDIWISSGWLSRDRLGTVTFKPILGNYQYNKFKGKS